MLKSTNEASIKRTIRKECTGVCTKFVVCISGSGTWFAILHICSSKYVIDIRLLR
ncbi:hypothetical protein HanRHA438_Chr11g0511941 [Helianthus annuus]|nr:hypothetical protein HanOQP8_Chr11g0412411 [Helianthus annuus]KAJ0871404.1 hypothetical protein HanRHA438_Chr11g0511941 [Helianthus annuus]